MKIIVDYKESLEVEPLMVHKASYLYAYIIEIEFNNGDSKRVNFESFLKKSIHPSINKYLDQSLFSEFKIVDGNLNWNDYDLIFPVYDLYTGNI